MLIKQVIDVQADRRIVRYLILGHRIPYRIPRPVHIGRPRTHPVHRLPRRAGDGADVGLCLDASAQGQAIKRAGQTIGSGSLEQVRGVATPVTVHTAEVQVGVARIDVPVRGQGAGDFQVDAVGFLAGTGLVGIATGRGGQAVVEHSLVFLLGAEVRRRCIQATLQPLAFDAGFVALAANGLDLGAALGFCRLRVEDVGVTGVQRIGVVEVVHGAQVGGDDAVVLLGAAHAANVAGGG